MNSDRRPSLFWPLLLVGLGVLLLLQNLGLLPPGMWEALAQLWPVLLILLGLDILIGRRSAAGAVVVVLIGALTVAAALTWAAVQASRLPAGQSQVLSQTILDAESASVHIDFDVGELNVSALGGSDHLMEGQVYNGPGESAEQSYKVADGVGQLTLTQRRQALFTPFVAAKRPTTSWEIRLAPHVPLTLEVKTGVGKATLDLSGLSLTGLDMSTGIGETNLIFPAEGSMQARVTAGIGDVTLTIPTDLPARLTVKSGLTGVQIPARFSRDGNVYTTPGFTETGRYLDLELTAGMGNVVVQ